MLETPIIVVIVYWRLGSRAVALSLTSGEASVKAFLAACLEAIVVAASWIVLNSGQEPANRAFATSPYTRVGD